MDRDETLRKMAALKRLPSGSTLLRGEHGGAPFSLVLLTADRASDNGLMQLLSDWRRAHEQWFPAVFKVTVEGTSRWYRDQVIGAPDRLLFLVTSQGEFLGHVGLFRFAAADATCEIDNIVRGAAGQPGLMEAAVGLMMAWGERELGVRGYRLQTFADNARALRLYERLGFRETARNPLVRSQSGDRVEWVEGPEVPGAVVRYNVHMFRNGKKISFAGPWITQKEIDYVNEAVRHGWYKTFDMHIRRLEKAVCDYVGMEHVVATHCCTVALHLACEALGLEEGDEVICTDFSWVATAHAILYTGAKPVFVDVDPESWCIAPAAIEEAVTPRTRAIMLVHTFGHPAQMDEIMAIAKRHGLAVIEDAAPAMGAEFKGQPVGSFGDFGCFSFHGAKVAVSGEGGIILMNGKELHHKVERLANMGRTDSEAVFWSDFLGYQYTIGNLPAALALAQVERIEELVGGKRRIFGWYDERLAGVEGLTLIREKKDCRSNYCYPSLLVDEGVTVPRDRIVRELKELNIHCRPTFPQMSRFPMYEQRYPNPVAARVARQGISLAAAADLTEEDVDFVCRSLRAIIGR